MTSAWARLGALYGRFRLLIHEAARFGIVGFAGFVITDVCANVLRYQAGLDRISSVAIAIIFATAVTFAANRYWTYSHRARSGLVRETVLFFVMNGIALVISELPVAFTYPLHLDGGLSYNIAVNAGLVLATLFRYWSYKKWVWRARSVPAETAGPESPQPGYSVAR
ncbi:MAG TPA: GtrA family protein [Streptosporangiaceae bacterium]|nr:GtrA family protein [Streptosporangiaceae bacterium]